MKRVSFEIAKAIKEAGYPQDYKQGSPYYNEKGQLMSYDWELEPLYGPIYCVCPYVLQVWLWLWREKRIYIDVVKYLHTTGTTISKVGIENMPFKLSIYDMDDPEEAIIEAIDYLVENDLIK